MQFCAKFSNFSLFIKYLDSIRDLSEIVQLECYDESIIIEVMNLTLGTIVHVKFSLDFFQEYRRFEDRNKNLSFTVNTLVFYELLKMAQKGDIVELSSNDIDNRLDLVINSPNGASRTFKLNLYSNVAQARTNFQIASTDNLKFKSNFSIQGNELINIGNKMQIFSNVFDLIVDTNYVEFKITNELISGLVSILIDERHVMDLKQSCKAKYSCKPIHIFNKTIYDNSKINVKILENNELLLMTDYNENVFLRFCLVSNVDYLG